MRALFLLLFVSSCSLVQCAPAPASPTPRPTRAPIAPAAAVQAALDAIQADAPVGHLVGAPSEVRGSLTTFGQAVELVNGTPLPANSMLARQRERAAWLIVTRGEWLLHIPGAHGDPARGTPTIMSKDLNVPNLWNATILDASSGDVLMVTALSPARVPNVETLPALPIPANSSVPQITPIATTQP